MRSANIKLRRVRFRKVLDRVAVKRDAVESPGCIFDALGRWIYCSDIVPAVSCIICQKADTASDIKDEAPTGCKLLQEASCQRSGAILKSRIATILEFNDTS